MGPLGAGQIQVAAALGQSPQSSDYRDNHSSPTQAREYETKLDSRRWTTRLRIVRDRTGAHFMMLQADMAACNGGFVTGTHERQLVQSGQTKNWGRADVPAPPPEAGADPGSTQAVSAAADSFRAGAGAHYSIAYCH